MYRYTNETFEMIENVQSEILKIYGKYDLEKALLWMTEELGETIQSIRKKKTKNEITEEIGDLAVWIFCICNILGIEFKEALIKTIEKEINRQMITYHKLKYLEEDNNISGQIKEKNRTGFIK